MDWSELGSKVAATGAKVLGEAIPVPGAGIAADAVADALGTEKDPDEIANAIENDPEAAAKLKQAELDHKKELERIKAKAKADHEAEITSRQASTNETMREGYRQGVLWRRAVGWSLAVVVPVVVLGIMAMAGMAIYLDRPEIMEHVPAVISALGPIWYVYMVVLGVAGYQEGKMGRAMAGDKEGGLAQAVRAIKG
ncbi:hypothetical protein [Thiohalorhabdus sp.]|uniref:hypothetical protein n=1 Tax=Thiohalorhabdus sp. TaxID=3094134 RepID=UPI002FC38993